MRARRIYKTVYNSGSIRETFSLALNSQQVGMTLMMQVLGHWGLASGTLSSL